jgi:hypothetical protein
MSTKLNVICFMQKHSFIYWGRKLVIPISNVGGDVPVYINFLMRYSKSKKGNDTFKNGQMKLPKQY